jgi:hypothetical protein
MMQTIELTVSPWQFDIDVTACVDPGEPATRDHPGWEPNCVIEQARVNGVSIFDMLDNWQLTRLEEAVMRACDL